MRGEILREHGLEKKARVGERFARVVVVVESLNEKL